MSEYATPLPMDVVAERLRTLTSRSNALNPFRIFESSPFFGIVEKTDFELQMNLPYRAPVVVTLTGRLTAFSEGGHTDDTSRDGFRTRVSVRAGVAPISYGLLAFFSGALALFRLEVGIGFAVLFGLTGAIVTVKERKRGMDTLRKALQLELLAR